LDALRVATPFSSASLHLPDLRSERLVLSAETVEEGLPLFAQLLSSRPDALGEVLTHPVGDEELRVLGPAVRALRLPDLLLPQRLPVRLGGVDLVW
jgi:hypothetical protein